MHATNKHYVLLAALTASLALVGCDRSKSATETNNDSPEAEAKQADKTDKKQKAQQKSHGEKNAHQPGAGDAITAFHEMDGRTPLPLTPMMANHQRQNMRDHLVAIQEIVRAAADEDFDGVEKAAGRIGSSPQMKQMCNHMGAGAEGFTEKALGFHETADGIIAAAEKEDYQGVMTATADTIGTCTSCHAQYKQKIVTDKVWRKKTGMGAPSGGMHQKHHGGGHH
jgi:cytochrome c556